MDAFGAAFVGGNTGSVDFPVASGAFQTAAKGDYDGFAFKLSSTGKALLFSTLVGGSKVDAVASVALDQTGNLLLAGYTNSRDFPFTESVQSDGAEESFDGFVAGLDSSGKVLRFSTHLGGSAEDEAFAVTAGASGHVYVGGKTASADFPSPIPRGSIQEYDSFLTEVRYDSSLLFVPVAPCRIADTRTYGVYGSVFGAPFIARGTERSFLIPSASCAIPATARAYSLNITVVPRSRYLGYLLAWPTGSPRPFASNLNSMDGRIVANAAIVSAGTSGAVSVYASDDTEVILDINGYFVDSMSGGLAFYPLKPCRAADTRGYGVSGPFGTPFVAANTRRDIPLLSSGCGIPAAAQAYSLNITVIPRGPVLGYLLAWPAGRAMPVASTLNSPTGTIVANAAIVPAGAGGAISLFASHDTDVVVDINGYFALPGAPSALRYEPMSPCRVADTRDYGFTGEFGPPALTPIGPPRTLTIPQSACGIPVSAKAYSLNVTAVPIGRLGFLTLVPAGQGYSTVSTLNALTGTIVANLAIVPSGDAGGVSIYSSDRSNAVVDIGGYFIP